MNSSGHVVLHGSLRPAKTNALRLRDVNPSEHIEVTLDLRGPELPGADALPKKAMTGDQFAAKYGAIRETPTGSQRSSKTMGSRLRRPHF
jgi:pyruvate kinase